ncbi:Rv2175c family DNA-binding protein [Glutamicibacter sp. M10]|uniref:Rv2175c family DNA-binding protein n=1 Tax=Glutamicibacter sp. M10 TaxID=3023076 RepID=UPI0021C7A8AA|nr:Rv2175c family DNA-binding protein [Glutamicibacter sp. M10]UXN30653.1 Rv2175c family DNA-binding protein [Glutamicibacter sp. M10]
MKEIVDIVGQWLTLPDVAEELEIDIRQVHRLLDERAIVSVRIGERKVRSIPADFLQDGSVVESLKGTLSVLLDAAYSDEESIMWLFTEDDSLPGTPMDALRSGRKTEIRRRAQALGW